MFENEAIRDQRITAATERDRDRSGRGAELTGKGWCIAVLYAASAAAFGLVVGYFLSGQPELSSIRSKLSRNAPDALRLRLDYQLREANLCAERSAPCASVRLGAR